MSRFLIVSSVLSLLLGAFSFAQSADESALPVLELFNGRDLEGWHVYVDDPAIDPADVWHVEDGLLRATGVGKGYVRTDMAYADYKLQLEWRWPSGPGNSGVMVNIVNRDELWPKSFEAQLKTGAAGDFGSFVDARSNEEIVSRNPKGVSTGRLPRPGPSRENPLGEWNTYDIVVEGDTITLAVNGGQVNRMTGVRPTAGMIGLQAEGTAIDFRHITLTPLPPAKDMYAPMPQ
jgi:3-keto-disaccharide hydrolase